MIVGSAVALTWCVAATSAQQPASTNAPAHNVFVATGCLDVSADETPKFKLTDASSIGRAAPAPASEAGAVGTSGLKVSYELQPVSGLNAQGMDAEALKAHAGQRVEVTLRPTQNTAAPASPTASSLGVPAAKPVDTPPERYSVTAIKRAPGMCS
jgi:hypothetical protein